MSQKSQVDQRTSAAAQPEAAAVEIVTSAPPVMMMSVTAEIFVADSGMTKWTKVVERPD
jgi:hypothetical protein